MTAAASNATTDDALAKRRTRGHITSWPTGRTCADAECETSLSRYNKDALCWKHAEQRDVSRMRTSQ